MQETGRTKTRKPGLQVKFIDNKLVLKGRFTIKGHDITIDVDLPITR